MAVRLDASSMPGCVCVWRGVCVRERERVGVCVYVHTDRQTDRHTHMYNMTHTHICTMCVCVCVCVRACVRACINNARRTGRKSDIKVGQHVLLMCC